MAAIRTFVLPHYPDYPIQVALFKDVTNAAFLRSQLLEANPDFDYAFVDATMVRIIQFPSRSNVFAQSSRLDILSASIIGSISMTFSTDTKDILAGTAVNLGPCLIFLATC
jgi:hypothetical protein